MPRPAWHRPCNSLTQRRFSMVRHYKLFPALLLAAGVAAAAPACAAQTYGYGYPRTNGGYRRDIERRAYDKGYREGLEEGQSDARDRARFDPVRAKRYRDGDHDYNNRYGDRDTYKREYRSAFEQGYREGYGQTR